ncbi:MAG: glycosyltransferase [Planctomycetes bacterium]|nr:glycosyltransferase [Planctomycetota bacterium]
MKFASVLLSTYYQPKALQMSLYGYLKQTNTNFEVIVSDDGSDIHTKVVIEELSKIAPFKIFHVWQPNKGYRRSKIVNKAFGLSSGQVIILSDGDCIPHRNFLETHMHYHATNRFCVGGYVRLSQEYSEHLNAKIVEDNDLAQLVSFNDKVRFYSNHIKSFFYKLTGKINRPKVYGCHISVDRNLFESVNGYDENFDGFGKEDSDLRNRMNMSGAEAFSVWNKTWVYHIDDSLDPGVKLKRIPRNKDKARSYYYREEVAVRCKNGIIKEV